MHKPKLSEATHEVVDGAGFGEVIKTGTYMECTAFMSGGGMILRTAGETARVKAAQAVAYPAIPSSDDMASLAAGLAAMLDRAEDAGLAAFMPAHVHKAFRELSKDLESMSAGEEVARPEYLYQFDADLGDWEECDVAQYVEFKEEGIKVRRFILVKE